MPRKRNYLNNRDLLNEIIKSKELDELTPKALEFLMLLAATVLGLIYDTDIDNGTIDSWPG